MVLFIYCVLLRKIVMNIGRGQLKESPAGCPTRSIGLQAASGDRFLTASI